MAAEKFKKVKAVDYTFLGYKGDNVKTVVENAQNANSSDRLQQEFGCTTCKARISLDMMGEKLTLSVSGPDRQLTQNIPSAANEARIYCPVLERLNRQSPLQEQTNCK